MAMIDMIKIIVTEIVVALSKIALKAIEERKEDKTI